MCDGDLVQHAVHMICDARVYDNVWTIQQDLLVFVGHLFAALQLRTGSTRGVCAGNCEHLAVVWRSDIVIRVTSWYLSSICI